jgi:hypothetical protein
MKTILIGKVTEVKAIETKDSYSSQRITILVQEFDQSTGEAKDPQIFPVTIFNKKIKELAAEQYQGKRVKATCWLRSLTSIKDDKTFYNIVLNCTNIELFD